MTPRALLAWVCLIVLTIAAPAFAQSSVPAAQPAPRIVAIGDLHGDHGAWRAIAQAAGVMDGTGRWTGGTTILVQTGDVPDRGPDTLKIIDDLMWLQQTAPATGGRVVALVGNHEAMNVTNDLRYVDPGEYAAFATKKSARIRQRFFEDHKEAIVARYRAKDWKLQTDAVRTAWLAATPLGMVEHRAAWNPAGRIGRWVIANPAAVLIDGNLFVHGGVSAAYAALPIADINRQVAAALTARDESETAIINAENGPLWYRGYAVLARPAPAAATAPYAAAAAELDTVLKAQGARRMIVGHTPIVTGIAITQDGRLAHIDTGASAYYKGQPAWLEISGDTLTAHAVARPNGGK